MVRKSHKTGPVYLNIDKKEKSTNQALGHSTIYNLNKLDKYANFPPENLEEEHASEENVTRRRD